MGERKVFKTGRMLIVAKHEALSNVKSIRLLILIVLLALSVIGGAYGISGIAVRESVEKPKIVAFQYLLPLDSPLNDDYVIYVYDLRCNPVDGARVVLKDYSGKVVAQGGTKNGMFVIHNVSGDIYGSTVKIEYGGSELEFYALSSVSVSPSQIYMSARVQDADDDNIADDVYLLVVSARGEPVPNASVYIKRRWVESDNYTLVGETNTYGVLLIKNLNTTGVVERFGAVKPGMYSARACLGNTEAYATFIIAEDDSYGRIKINDANDVIRFMGSTVLYIMIPIVAIALSFDSIVKEKIQNSMVFLLSRPVGRKEIVLGKFIGMSAVLIIPMIIVNLGGIMLISHATGTEASMKYILTFLLVTSVLTMIYILLQITLSSIAKTTGTAILSGIGLLLIFIIFWGLISLAVNAILGNPLGSEKWIEVSNKIALFNPSGSYQHTLTFGYHAIYGRGAPGGIEWWMPYISLAVWIV
ncbi:MAG: hypothetical protein DRN20_03890, partial [Thermoplasmata archaeon]